MARTFSPPELARVNVASWNSKTFKDCLILKRRYLEIFFLDNIILFSKHDAKTSILSKQDAKKSIFKKTRPASKVLEFHEATFTRASSVGGKMRATQRSLVKWAQVYSHAHPLSLSHTLTLTLTLSHTHTRSHTHARAHTHTHTHAALARQVGVGLT